MGSLDEIQICNFRNLEEIILSPKAINIIVGPNNSGKSSIIEAITLLLTAQSEFYDVSENNILKELFEVREYRLQSIIRSGSEHATISCRINDKRYKLNLELISKEKATSPRYEKFVREFIKHRKSVLLSRLEKFLLSSSSSSRIPSAFHRSEIERQLGDLSSELISEYVEKNLHEMISTHHDEIDHIIEDKINEELDTLSLKNKLIVELNGSKNWDEISLLHLMTEENEIRSNRRAKVNFASDLDNGSVDQYGHYKHLKVNSPKRDRPEIVKVSTKLHQFRQTTQFIKLHDKLVKEGKFGNVINELKRIIPEFEELRYATSDDVPWVTIDDETLPLSSQGQGFLSLINILQLFVLTESGIVLLEEPEISMHPRYMNQLTRSFLEVKNSPQIFMTTHSTELLNYLIDNAKQKGKLDEIRIIRLHQRNDLGGIEIQEIDGDKAQYQLEEIELDLRGI